MILTFNPSLFDTDNHSLEIWLTIWISMMMLALLVEIKAQFPGVAADTSGGIY